jgi:hypothetical protein
VTYTGAELLRGFSEFINDYFSSETTAAGNAGGTTLIDATLKRYQSKRLQGRFVRVTDSGDNQYITRAISSNDGSTGVVDLVQAFPSQIVSGVSYEIHKFNPEDKFRALDEAMIDSLDSVYQLVYDETITADGTTDTFKTPPNIELGPITVYEENPAPVANILWNFLNSPIGDSTNYWTASAGVTASTVETNYSDMLIPKYDYGATILEIAASTASSYSQTVANMVDNVTAELAAGRTMSFCMWVYSVVPNRAYLSIEDDEGTVTSDYHGGRGWQLLSIQKNIVGNNSTTLTTSLNITAGDALKLAWNRSWFYFGETERITESYYSQAFPNVRWDDVTQTFSLSRIPMRGHQLRLVGQKKLTSLGSNVFDQTTNAVQVDEITARILYSYAASILFEWQGITSTDVPEVFQRIATIQRRANRVGKYGQVIPTRNVSTPYWR